MTSATLFVDTHVHIRKRFNRAQVFAAAARNFAAAARQKQVSDWAGVLMLTESATENAFKELESLLEGAEKPVRLDGWGDWCGVLCRDGISVRVSRSNGSTEHQAPLFVIAGRQIDTSERLEVSALGSDEFIPDGLPIEEVLKRARAHGTYQILPWAPGKWSFARGRRIDAMLTDGLTDELTNGGEYAFALGDNGGRPAIWPRSRFMRKAVRLGIPVLPGSDPLPFDSELQRIGSYGVQLTGEFDAEHPGRSVLALLRAQRGQPDTYGRLNSAFAFFRNEIQMQLTKRARTQAAAARKA